MRLNVRYVIVALAGAVVLMFQPAVLQAAEKKMQIGAVEADASLVLAGPPASGFDNGIGITIGAGIMLPMLDNKLQGRVDLAILSWDANMLGTDLTYSRYPLTVSGRYYFPLKVESLKVYAQGGLEVSFDKVDMVTIVFLPPATPIYGKDSVSETNLGITPGGGIDFAINSNLSIVADLRYHIISDPYFTVQGGISYKF